MDLKKLKEAGLNTVESILYTAKKNLVLIKGLTELKLDKIIECCQKLLPQPFVTAESYLQQRQNVLFIPTGSQALDQLLNGGIESHSITELFGEFRTGKTQLCHTLCVTAQMMPRGGKSMYIDTEGTFRPERLVEIAERFGLDSKQVLENTIVGRARTCDVQNKLLIQAASLMSESRFALLVVDSATVHFRNDYLGRGVLLQ